MKSALATALVLCLAACGGGTSTVTPPADAGPTCQNSCSAGGAFRCVGASVESCDRDSQGCLAWSAPVACSASQVCQGGQCVTLDGGPSCQNACPSSGAVRCVGNGVESCDMGSNGCLAWSQPVACGSTQTCTGGACVSGSTCTNGCTGAGTLRCAGNTIQQCESGSSGCLNWADVSTCNSNQVCSNGACMSACQNGCTRAGDLRCAGNAIQQCSADASGCLNWSTTSTCSGAQVCSNGACMSPTCQSGCMTRGALQCAGNSVQQCSADSSGCLNWSVVSTCGSGETCSKGQCEAMACTNACPSAGSSQCVGGSVQLCEQGTNGCLAWTTPTPCGPGLTCVNSACTAACTNNCTAGQVRCGADGAGTQTCAAQPTGCTDWNREQPCGTGSTCSGAGACSTTTTTTGGKTGAPCTADAQCAGANNFCFLASDNFPGGYCSDECSKDSDCGSGGICVANLATDSSGNAISICMAACAANTDCRSGYFCGAEGNQDFCYPKCTSDAQCGQGGICNTATGVCSLPASGGYPAAFPTPPQVINGGGQPLAAPVIVPIFFAGDDATLVGQMKDFYAKVGSSTYWAALGEYGVGRATSAAPVTINAAAPTTVNDTITTGSDVWTFIQTNISNGTFPAPTANTIYVINYPAGTSITAGGEQSCTVFGAYHDEADLSGGNVAYAVIPRCAPPTGFQPIQWQTGVASHELVEASTDPFPNTNPAWSDVDARDYFWTAVAGGGEIGDMCINDPEAFYGFPDLPYIVQRFWSNAAAAAGHDPCQPGYTGEIFFNTVPQVSDTVSFPVGNQTVPVNGVSVPAGSSKTITLLSYSDADPGSMWSIGAFDFSSAAGGGATHLGLALSSAQGSNGGTVQLTITAKNTAGSTDLYYIVTTLNAHADNEADHIWFGIVGE